VSGSKTSYWPYGGQRVPPGQNPPTQTQTDRLYTGQRSEPGDSALGLYNYKARFYSTVLGRFVSADVAAPNSRDAQALNRYGYVSDNPVSLSDPSGHCFVWGGVDLTKATGCTHTNTINWIQCGIEQSCSADLNLMAKWVLHQMDFFSKVKNEAERDSKFYSSVTRIRNGLCCFDSREIGASITTVGAGEAGDEPGYGDNVPVPKAGDVTLAYVSGKVNFSLDYSYLDFYISAAFVPDSGDPAKFQFSLHVAPIGFNAADPFDEQSMDPISAHVAASLFDQSRPLEVSFTVAPKAEDVPPLWASPHAGGSGAILLSWFISDVY
jgi:RHS repeat-associated protein